MELTVTSVDYAPPELDDQVPFKIKLLCMLPGPDRPDYWIGEMVKPLKWINDNHEKQIKTVIVCARWQGTKIEPLVQNLPINIAYITDPSQLTNSSIDFSKSKFVAIGFAHETKGNANHQKPNKIMCGTIGLAFGIGRKIVK